ncbi:MAG: hypothetical protein JEZ00_14615 [Anaerolineaceae bacterium]|nr:hypothetical protein [Anaerolineaceae bacterium]
MSKVIPIGRILRANATGCMVGCQIDQADIPAIGDMVYIPIPQDERVYGIICNILVDDDGLVRQLVTSEQIAESVIQDNRLNRNVPLEMEVRFIGHTRQQKAMHLLPPRPPFSLDSMIRCSANDMRNFLTAGKYGYFRHLLRDQSPFFEEILSAHLRTVHHSAASLLPINWLNDAINEIIFLLRDDYESLMKVLSALSDADLILQSESGGLHVN